MKRIEFIQDNFLGMSYSNQIQVIEYLKEFASECGKKRISIEFSDVFDDYLEKLNLLRSVRKDLLKAFDVYKTNVSFGILLQTELEIAVAKKWYEKLLDLNEDAFLDIPSQISKYL